ncbi:DUF2577 domain-containing protein [Paenibacillus albicereus]|uniref:DUF2577 domain-containing protein n=1 Tax=Paenibacillus albicereus TaxID=2726185 RepID=A0A6H2GWC9_9BACL|nr:DUF2577 domain-containing protein [Paenibacillus albicereus]QJC51731.1 DUF2577 domain-containing protein [Paenibacillus albicereus]
MDRGEGSGASQLVQLMRNIGWNADTTIELGTVVSAPPELKIRIDHMELVLEKDDLVVAERLTKHTRKVDMSASEKAKMSAAAGDVTMTILPPPPAGTTIQTTIQGLSLDNGSWSVECADLTYCNELKAGERVIVAGVQQGQLYLVLDRAVTY